MGSKLLRRGTALVLGLFLLLGLIPGAAAEGSWAVVTGTGSLNVRATPGADGTWLGRASRGAWVERIYPAGSNWYYCRVVDSNLYGFMSGQYLTVYEGSGAQAGTGVVSNPAGTRFLNLREYPSYSARILGIFYNGQVCQILSHSNGWYNVLVNGMNGYFREEYVQVNGGSATPAETAVINAGGTGYAQFRDAPSSAGNLLGQYPNGTYVSVLLKGTDWAQVQLNGIIGFIECRFLQGGSTPAPTWNPVVTPTPAWGPVPTAQPAAQGYCIVSNPRASSYLNLREQPSLTAKVLAQYYNGVRLEVLEQGLTWCKVYGRASGKTGYVMTQYVTLHGLPSVPVKTVSNGNTYVNLRAQPNKTSGTVLQRLYSGAQVTVLIPGDTWTRVRYGNQEGYMMTQFLK